MSSMMTAEQIPVAEERSRLRRKRWMILTFAAAFVLASIVSYRVLRILLAIGWIAWRGGSVDWDINASNWRRNGVTSASFADNRTFHPSHISDADLLCLRDLHRLEHLSVANCLDITDAGLAAISPLKDLRDLDLSRNPAALSFWLSTTDPNAKLSDAALAHLKPLSRLTSLNLSGNRITDAGLAQLSGLTRLEVLELDDTPVTDAGLEHLKRMPRLRILSLSKTKVTKEGAMALERAIPGIVITLDPSPPNAP